MVQLTIKTHHAFKDQKKADQANKFIGIGSPTSSTNQYRKDYGDMANCGVYDEDEDIVFISAEGNRAGRLNPDFREINLAIQARVTLLTDNRVARNRSYNIGERQVAKFLEEHGYRESIHTHCSAWYPPK
jgi:hypothetical protein